MAGPWMTELEVEMVTEAVRNGWYGEEAYAFVETFEAEYAAYHDRKHALMTPNCTTALHLLLAGLGIKEGDEIIAPACTWIGSTACITYQRATPVFADIDPVHWCVTAETIEKAITDKTKAVIVVDLYGNMPDWDAIEKLCRERKIILIEDAAEAVGSIYKGTRAGKFGIGSVFSFHRTKTISTGEGGILLLDDDALFDRCKILRDHGRAPGAYYNVEVAYKYMPFNVQAALGLAQLRRIDELVEKKRWLLNSYKEQLSDINGIGFNPEPEGGINGVWCTAMSFDRSYGMKTQDVVDKLNKVGIPARNFFIPLPALPAYAEHSEGAETRLPVAYDIAYRAINLPCALNITEQDIEVICTGVRDIFCP